MQIAAQNDQFPTLSPNAIFSELRELVKRPQDFEYLRQEAMGLYHNFEGLIEEVRKVWLESVEEEMRASLDLEQGAQLREFLGKYVYHTTHHVRGEKLRNRVTGKSEDPDAALMKEFEKLVHVPAGQELDFRKNIIARLGAWSIENPSRTKGAELPYAEIFPDLMEKLVGHYREAQNSKIRAMGALMLDVKEIETLTNAPEDTRQLSEARQMLVKVYKGLQEQFGYGPRGAQEALVELIKARYV